MTVSPPLAPGRDFPAGGAIYGTGIGLRAAHVREVIEQRPDVPWFEILLDNHTARGGRIAAELAAVREHYPLTFHSVGLSLGSSDPLDQQYLANLKEMLERYEPAWFSDHLCFSSLDGTHFHDLLPLPHTEEAVAHVGSRITQVQDVLGQRILIENVSSYLTFTDSALSEAEFLAAVCERADCDLLLDLNNIYVNQYNHGLDAVAYLDTVPLDRVREIHLGGHENKGDFLLDAHNSKVSLPVWDLYRECVARIPGTPTLIEWDNDLPEFCSLQSEAAIADRIAAEVLASQEEMTHEPG